MDRQLLVASGAMALGSRQEVEDALGPFALRWTNGEPAVRCKPISRIATLILQATRHHPLRADLVGSNVYSITRVLNRRAQLLFPRLFSDIDIVALLFEPDPQQAIRRTFQCEDLLSA